MITVPQHPWLWSNTDSKAGHKRRYTSNELQEKISAAGFEVLGTFSFISLLLPFMLANRLLMKNRAKGQNQSRTQSGLRLPSILNQAFMKVCDLERELIKAGLTLPSGGSLVCTARKK